MDVSIELNVEEVQVAGSMVRDRASIILGSDEIGFTLCGTKEDVKNTLQEMLDVLDSLTE